MAGLATTAATVRPHATAAQRRARQTSIIVAQTEPREGRSEEGRRAAQQRAAAAAVAVAAAAVVAGSAPSVDASVILEQPKLKTIFAQGGGSEQVVMPAGGGLSVPSLPGLPSFPSLPKPTSGTVALPLALLGIVAGGAAAYRLDDGFGAMMRRTVLKDSNVLGVGYEETIKDKLRKGKSGLFGR